MSDLDVHKRDHLNQVRCSAFYEVIVVNKRFLFQSVRCLTRVIGGHLFLDCYNKIAPVAKVLTFIDRNTMSYLTSGKFGCCFSFSPWMQTAV